VARGAVCPLIVTREFLDRMAQEGFRIREYAPPAGGSVQCTVTPQDDFLIARLAADLTSSIWRCAIRYPIVETRQLAAHIIVAKLLSIDATGERLVAKYTFNHTPSR
jgi:hypothetical protein